MALKYPDRLESNNPLAYGIVKAIEVAGHKTVNTKLDLLSISDSILSDSKTNFNNDAIGQQWYVYSEKCFYQLIDWDNRKVESGWKKILTDTSLNESIASILSSLATHKSNTSNPHSVTKVQVGLGNVDNTSDLNKPVSTATQTKLDTKVDKVTGKSLVSDSEITKLSLLPNKVTLDSSIADAKKAGTDALNNLNTHIANKENPHEVTKTQVGLSNVTNDAQVKRSEMGTNNGVATLDASGKILTSLLPSFVDDVIEATSKSDFPIKGESGKIYVALDTNLTYRWGGSSYIEISQSLALGETSSTAYAGDKGKQTTDNLNKHLQNNSNPHLVTKEQIGLANVDNTSDADKPISISTQAALNTKLDEINTPEYNVSQRHPNLGVEYSNKYTLQTAIQLIPDNLRYAGIKCTFVNTSGKIEIWTWNGGDYTNLNTWVLKEGGKLTVQDEILVTEGLFITGGNMVPYITEYNVSVLYPTSGVDNTDKYDLTTAIKVLNSSPTVNKTIGTKLTFIPSYISKYKVESYKFIGPSFSDKSSWVAIEYLQDTPSGNPMHYIYEAAGAVWNPKTKFWELNGILDIDNEEMDNIYVHRDYSRTDTVTLEPQNRIKGRTNIFGFNSSEFQDVSPALINFRYAFVLDNELEVLNLGFDEVFPSSMFCTFYLNPNLRKIIGVFNLKQCTDFFLNFDLYQGNPKLEEVFIKNLKSDLKLQNEKVLNLESVRYMIANAYSSINITITLHPDVYAKAINDEEVKQALTSRPNVSIVSA